MSKLVSVAAHHPRHEPAGLDEINDIDIGNTGVLLSAHKARHLNAGADQFAAGDVLNATARVGISKNSGAIVGTRREINLIEGANITLTIADDVANEEVDVTIAAAGGAGGGDMSQFFPATDPDSNIGTYPSMVMPDLMTSTIRQSFIIPKNITTITQASLLIITVASGNISWYSTTNFALICATENYNTHTDNTAPAQTACILNKVTCLDITGALTGAASKDIIGVEFIRSGADALDTIGASVHFLGIYVEGT